MVSGEDRDLVAQAMSDARYSNGWWRANCPFCPSHYGKEDRRGSLGLRQRDGYFHCFRCGVEGWAKGVLFDAMPEQDAPDPDPVEIQPPDGFALLYDGANEDAISLEPARAYLAGRGLDVEPLRSAQVGACLSGYCAGRIVVPIMTGATWIGWVARAWSYQASLRRQPDGDDVSLPYLYARGMVRATMLYNVAALSVQTDAPALIVEGVLDALACWPDGVAVLGKPSEGQMPMLLAARRPLCVVLDGDAWEQGEALALRLRFDGMAAGFVRLPPRTDPDEVPLDWLRAEARKSIDA